MADHLDQQRGIDAELAEIADSQDTVGMMSGVRRAVLAGTVMLAASPVLGQEPLAPTPAQMGTLTEIDPNAQIVDNVIIVASSAEAACAIVNTGAGFYALALDRDPRVLAVGGVGGGPTEDVVETDVFPVMPEGMDDCYWRALNDMASPKDVMILASFYNRETDAVEIPPPPVFASGQLSPTLIGLEEGAVITEIGPRFGELMALRSSVGAASQRDYYTRVAVLDADAAETDLASAETDLATAQRDAAAARALLEDLRSAVTN